MLFWRGSEGPLLVVRGCRRELAPGGSVSRRSVVSASGTIDVIQMILLQHIETQRQIWLRFAKSFEKRTNSNHGRTALGCILRRTHAIATPNIAATARVLSSISRSRTSIVRGPRPRTPRRALPQERTLSGGLPQEDLPFLCRAAGMDPDAWIREYNGGTAASRVLRHAPPDLP